MLDRIENPVFARELSRWYKRKPFVVITGVIYLLYLGYCIWMSTFDIGGTYGAITVPYALIRSRMLLSVAISVFFPVFVMVCLVVPVLAATSVAGERRSQTLMPVQLSLLRPFDIVWPKVVAPVVPILFPAGISMLTLGLLLLRHGGFLVAGAGAVSMLTVVMCSAFIVSAVSVLISALARSSAIAIILSYAVLFPITLTSSNVLFYIAIDRLLR